MSRRMREGNIVEQKESSWNFLCVYSILQIGTVKEMEIVKELEVEII